MTEPQDPNDAYDPKVIEVEDDDVKEPEDAEEERETGPADEE